MSGGSHDYAYSKLHELDRWVSTLDDMARLCREWAGGERGSYKHVLRNDGSRIADRVDSTIEDRARVLVRGMLLEKAAARLRRAVDEVKGLERLMHDVEWVDSCDYGVDALMGSLEESE